MDPSDWNGEASSLNLDMLNKKRHYKAWSTSAEFFTAEFFSYVSNRNGSSNIAFNTFLSHVHKTISVTPKDHCDNDDDHAN